MARCKIGTDKSFWISFAVTNAMLNVAKWNNSKESRRRTFKLTMKKVDFSTYSEFEHIKLHQRWYKAEGKWNVTNASHHSMKTFQSCELIEKIKRNRLHRTVVTSSCNSCADDYKFWNSQCGYLEINEWICEKYSKSSVAGETAILEQFAVSFVHLTAKQLRSTCFSTGIFRIRIMGTLCCYWIKMPILQIADWFWCWKLRIHTGYVSEWVSVNTTKKENITMWN